MKKCNFTVCLILFIGIFHVNFHIQIHTYVGMYVRIIRTNVIVLHDLMNTFF